MQIRLSETLLSPLQQATDPPIETLAAKRARHNLERVSYEQMEVTEEEIGV